MNLSWWVALMLWIMARKLARPEWTTRRVGVGELGSKSSGTKDVEFMPRGSTPPASATNVAARSIVLTGQSTTALEAIPGPAQISGTDMADCHGLDLAVEPLSASISPWSEAKQVTVEAASPREATAAR